MQLLIILPRFNIWCILLCFAVIWNPCICFTVCLTISWVILINSVSGSLSLLNSPTNDLKENTDDALMIYMQPRSNRRNMMLKKWRFMQLSWREVEFQMSCWCSHDSCSFQENSMWLYTCTVMIFNIRFFVFVHVSWYPWICNSSVFHL